MARFWRNEFHVVQFDIQMPNFAPGIIRWCLPQGSLGGVVYKNMCFGYN